MSVALIVVGAIAYVVGWGIATRVLYQSLISQHGFRNRMSTSDYAVAGIAAAVCALVWPFFAPFIGLGRLLRYLDERNRARQG